ncbi:MAG: hypothetical protein IKI03_02475 [Clostridia bacterium]|nr:hypothetical protein [Clostridia bacterium]
MRKWIEEATKNRIPPLGHRDSYFLGSGAVGISGYPDGEIDFAIGPDYTCPNYIESETVSLFGHGDIRFEMSRLRGCGTFFGASYCDGLRFTVTDAARPGSLSVLRLLTVENERMKPAVLTIRIRIKADKNALIPGDGSFEIVKEPGEYCFGAKETKNWAERRLRISVPGSEYIPEKYGCSLKISVRLKPGDLISIPVWHDFAYGKGYDRVRISPPEYVRKAAEEWGEWLNKGEYPRRIGDIRLRDIVESLLLTVRMQQNRDGGMIAGIRKYANSYVRDTNGGARMLLACGHTDEVGLLLLNIHTRWEKAGFIPNWWSMGSDTFIGESFNNNASEVTAYYILLFRDYLAHGGDASLAERVFPSVKWAADKQVRFLKVCDFLMDFNGDETEQYCSARDGEEYGLFGNCHSSNRLGFEPCKPSFASTAAAAGSLEWFGNFSGMNEYVEIAGKVYDGLDRFNYRGHHSWTIDDSKTEDVFDCPRKTVLTNSLLLPLWLGIRLPGNAERNDALYAVSFRRTDTGYIPNSPGVIEGFCGHTLGLALFDMLKLEDKTADELADTITYSGILGQYGTVSEFYGPGGVPNGHGNRPFEGGIVGEALVEYVKKNQK